MEKSRRETGKAKKILNKFEKLGILVRHQPPYGFLDQVTSKVAPKHWQGKYAGIKTILNYIKNHQNMFLWAYS